MNIVKEKLLERKKLAKVVSEWADKNKKVFWKYEVSSFYKTYLIKVNNLPEPSINDIQLSSNNKLLSEQQKKQLCDAITKACTQGMVTKDSSCNVQIDYVDGAIVASAV